MKGKHTMEEYEVISIPVSDGTERDFAIMDTFEFEGQGYLAVSLIEGDEIQEAYTFTVIIMQKMEMLW